MGRMQDRFVQGVGSGLARPGELGREKGIEGLGVVALEDSVVAAGGAVGARGGGLGGGGSETM
jgi:hypothetical protein